MRCSKNEYSELSYLRQRNAVHGVFDVGMLSCEDNPYLDASKDAMDLLEYPEFYVDCGWGEYKVIDVGGERYAMAVVEINTAVSVP